jgi:regulator of protease activity HflC (stomatin/prohibitin superfamily)
MQPATLFIPEQEVSTRDKSLLQVDAEVSYRVVDPAKAVTQVENYSSAVRLFCAITFRSVLGELDKDELLKDRQKTNRLYRELLSATLSNWGIEVSDVDIRA